VTGEVRGFGKLAKGSDRRAGLGGNCVKGEAFREVREGVKLAKVRRFGIEMAVVGWKCPADGGLRVPVYEACNGKGEAFQERVDEEMKSAAVRKTGLR
jgi:hypothetical protein